MGFGKASEMLLTEREFSSQEALQAGLVTRVLEEEGFLQEVGGHCHGKALQLNM